MSLQVALCLLAGILNTFWRGDSLNTTTWNHASPLGLKCQDALLQIQKLGFVISGQQSCRKFLILCIHAKSFLSTSMHMLSFSAGVAHDGLSAIKGNTPLVRSLHYVDFNRIWIVPFCHAFYLGVLKDFLNAIFAKKSAGGEQVCLLQPR